MKNVIIIAGLFFIWSIAPAQKSELIPDDFGMNASIHVKKLCEFGVRLAGSDAEKKTIDYLVKEFEMNGMNVNIDTITYRFYHLNNRAVYINNCKVPIKTAFINHPVNDKIKFESYCMKLTNANDEDDLFNKVVFTSASINSVVLNKYKPKAIIVIDPSVFDTLTINTSEKMMVTFVGHPESEWIKSYNVIATYKHNFPVDSTIVITAHWDSNNGVGAGDNASGTAALIELSKFFSKRLTDLKYNLTFIATGSEEPGLIGSISYVLNHTVELDKCFFNLNIDDIVYKKPYIETTNLGLIRNRADTSQTLTIISDRFLKGHLFTSFMEIWGNHYTDLSSAVLVRHKFEKSMSALGYDFQDAGCCSGVDSRAFDYISIPYISLSSYDPDSKEDNANTPNDVYHDSFIENINLYGIIASKILLDINQ
jgi:hypothetical protein